MSCNYEIRREEQRVLVKTLTEDKAESLEQYKKDFSADYRCTQVLILTLCKLF